MIKAAYDASDADYQKAVDSGKTQEYTQLIVASSKELSIENLKARHEIHRESNPKEIKVKIKALFGSQSHIGLRVWTTIATAFSWILICFIGIW